MLRGQINNTTIKKQGDERKKEKMDEIVNYMDDYNLKYDDDSKYIRLATIKLSDSFDVKINMGIENENYWVNSQKLLREGINNLFESLENSGKEWRKTTYSKDDRVGIKYSINDTQKIMFFNSINDPEKIKIYNDIIALHKEVRDEDYKNLEKDLSEFLNEDDKLKTYVQNERKEEIVKNLDKNKIDEIKRVENKINDKYLGEIKENIITNSEKSIKERKIWARILNNNNVPKSDELENLCTAYVDSVNILDKLYYNSNKTITKKTVLDQIDKFKNLAEKAKIYRESLNDNDPEVLKETADGMYKFAVENGKELSSKYNKIRKNYSEEMKKSINEVLHNKNEKADEIIAKTGKLDKPSSELKPKSKEAPQLSSRPRI